MDEDGDGKFRLERVKTHSLSASFVQSWRLYGYVALSRIRKGEASGIYGIPIELYSSDTKYFTLFY